MLLLAPVGNCPLCQANRKPLFKFIQRVMKPSTRRDDQLASAASQGLLQELHLGEHHPGLVARMKHTVKVQEQIVGVHILCFEICTLS